MVTYLQTFGSLNPHLLVTATKMVTAWGTPKCDLSGITRSEEWRLIHGFKFEDLSIFCSFKSVVQGNHTLFREYSYIQKTPHNKASFIRVFWKCFRHIGRNGGNHWSCNWATCNPKKTYKVWFIKDFEECTWLQFWEIKLLHLPVPLSAWIQTCWYTR